MKDSLEKLSIRFENTSMTVLRLSLAITFLWFGILKLFNVSPAIKIIQLAMPAQLVHSQLFFFLLSALEICIGIAFFMPRLARFAAVVMILHLFIATISVLFTQGFDPRFPVLSLPGEFVVKNFVLIGAGLVIITHRSEVSKQKKDESK